MAMAVRRNLALNPSTVSAAGCFCRAMRASTSCHKEKPDGFKSGEYVGNLIGWMFNSSFAFFACVDL